MDHVPYVSFILLTCRSIFVSVDDISSRQQSRDVAILDVFSFYLLENSNHVLIMLAIFPH
jgi:hypothetical protein